METSRRHTTQEQREFERIKKNVTVGDRTAEPATSTAQAQPTRQNQGGTYSLTLQYNGANVNSNTSKIDFLDTGTFVSANITFRITKVGAKTTIEAYGNGFLPDGTIHQTLRHTTGTAKEWIANDRLRNRGDSNHTYSANEGAVEIKSFSGETGALLRVLGITGSNVYGIYTDTDNQTAIFGEATGTGYGMVAYSNLGTGLLAESVAGAAVHAIGNNGEGVYATSANGYAVYGNSTNSVGIIGISAYSYGVHGECSLPSASFGDFAGVKGVSSTDNGIGVWGQSQGNGGAGLYGQSTDATGYGLRAINSQNNGYAASIVASGTNSVGLYVEGTLWGLETTSDIATGNVHAGDFYSGGTKVVGAQGAAVADATGAGDVVAQLNALLARMRTHGLIAP